MYYTYLYWDWKLQVCHEGNTCIVKSTQQHFFIYFHRNHFYQFGEISSIHVVPKQKCAFVTFSTRPAAEKAADGSFNKVIIKGTASSIILFYSIYMNSIDVYYYW